MANRKEKRRIKGRGNQSLAERVVQNLKDNPGRKVPTHGAAAHRLAHQKIAGVNDIISDDYLIQLRQFDKMLKEAMRLSNSTGGISVPTGHLIRVTQIYLRLVVLGNSFMHLLPCNTDNANDFWDYSSVGTLARGVLETFLVYWYVAIDDISEETYQFRFRIFQYHRNKELYKLYKGMKAPMEILKSFEDGFEDELNRISSDERFGLFDKEIQKKILRGEISKTMSNKEIAEKVPFLGKGVYEHFYRLLSNHTHGGPFIFMKIDNDRGRGEYNKAEDNYITSFCALVNSCLAEASKGHIKHFDAYCKEDFSDLESFCGKVLDTPIFASESEIEKTGLNGTLTRKLKKFQRYQ